MAQLIEMLVQGIRSIGPESTDAHVIKFLHPLTIISGPNGSGKTTLIEALNYVTTDAKPAGQLTTFVHSLDVCGRNRVDGLVMLHFVAANGKDVVASKRLNLSRAVKTGKLSGKSDEFTLALTDTHGNRTSLSAKVADTKQEILNLLDVPRAILSNVIFCHQENSTWPLSEPKVVKERFDAIFELTKYVKASEKLKKVRKEMEINIRVLNEKVNGCTQNVKDKGQKEADLANQKRRLAEINAKVDDTKGKQKQYLDIGEEAQKELEKHREWEKGRETSAIRHQNLIEQLQLVRVEDYPGSEEDIVREIEQIENSSEFRSIEQRREDLRRRIEGVGQEREEVISKKASLDQRKMKLLVANEKKNAVSLELGNLEDTLRMNYAIPLDAPVASEIDRMISLEKERIAQMRVSSTTQLERCDQEKSVIVGQVHEVRAQINSCREQKEKAEQELRTLQQKVNCANSGHSERQRIQRDITNLQRRRDQLGEVDADAVEEMRRRRERRQTELASIRSECEHAERFEEAERKIAEKAETERKLEELMVQHEEDFEIVFKKSAQDLPLPFGDRIRGMADKGKTGLNNVQTRQREAERAVDSARQTDEQKREEERGVMREIEEMREEIRKLALTDERKVDDKLNETQEQLQKTRKELGPVDAKAVLYEEYREEALQKNCCPLCERKFPSKAGAKDFASKLATMREQLPSQAEALSRRVGELEEREKALQRAVDKAEQMRKLESDRLEQIGTTRKKIAQELEKLEEALAEVNNDVIDVKRQTEAVNRILTNVSLMDSLHLTIDRLKTELEHCQIGDRRDGRTLSELKRRRQELEEEVAHLVSEGDRVQNVIGERNQLTTQINSLEKQLLDSGTDAANVAYIQQQLEEKQKEIRSLDGLQQELKMKLPELREREADAVEARRNLEQRCRENEAKIDRGVRELEMNQRELERLLASYQEIYVDQEEENQVNRSIEQAEQRLTECGKMVADLQAQLTNTDGMQDRKLLLENQRSRMILQNMIGEEKQKLEDFGEWDGHSKEKLEEKVERVIKANAQLDRMIGEAKGQVAEIQARITQLTKDLKEERFKGAETKFRKLMVEKVVTAQTAEDLKSYGGRLETALMEFHKTKMEAVNEILENLWRKVYRGTDIESIRIRSQMSGAGDRCKYDYKVVMVLDGGTEIEMRDRCSAGQKMLAAILIRIALSDVFGGQCSILALDEPTTNLDVQKIDDMADMLIDLINTRRADEGDPEDARQFQLIVITHDERFVMKLQQAVRPEYVYHVSKNEEGKSLLVKEMIDGSIEDAR